MSPPSHASNVRQTVYFLLGVSLCQAVAGQSTPSPNNGTLSSKNGNGLSGAVNGMSAQQSPGTASLGAVPKSSSARSLISPLGNDWVLAFRGTAGVGNSALAAFKLGDGIPAHVEPGCKQLGTNELCSSHYRNNTIIYNWQNIEQVTLVVYTGDVKVKQIIFNGKGTTHLNWFAHSRVKEASWTDLITSEVNYFSLDGDSFDNNRRHFYINQKYNGCNQDFGWFVVLDTEKEVCPWGTHPSFPWILYATRDVSTNWETGNVRSADAFGVYVKYG